MVTDTRTGWLAKLKVGDRVWTQCPSKSLLGASVEIREQQITRITPTGTIIVANGVRYKPTGEAAERSWCVHLVEDTPELREELKRLGAIKQIGSWLLDMGLANASQKQLDGILVGIAIKD